MSNPRLVERLVGPDLMDIYEKIIARERLTYEDGVRLFQHPDLTAVGYLANIVRERLHGQKAYYVRNQHINYTNICNKFCKFCSFYAKKGGPAPYTLSLEEVRRRLLMHIDVPITEVHMVGGINPRLPYQYYLDLLRVVKEVRPNVHIKAFTMVELVEIQRQAQKPLEEVLRELMAAGLDSLPGGGIEILSERVHRELFDRKIDGEGWMEVARTVAKVGLTQYATMLYGHIETLEERVEHLVRLRELQDETRHFVTMTPLAFHPEGTELADLPHSTGEDDLRTIAVARLMLDNFAHIKSFWIMNTPQVTQVALWYGADDVDGTVHEYEITYKDGEHGNKRQVLTRRQMIRLIEEAGRVPVERDSLYREIVAPPEEPQPQRRFVPLPVVD
ncbi:de-hypoxanthine futalosine cyclase [Chthonomonas calidirosea]|uniref:aminofutalosine synthase MqnE n=1 Tax=Chthonomonas calidirosea TaxID=454171 RepID=UPI0006DD5482|nr:aminofutalosine synthase MqnE [Chthonomonas calidirosea]CEK14986.1 de-hypoxanthine futalosine cyclase [Chthonomonas calidirosea]